MAILFSSYVHMPGGYSPPSTLINEPVSNVAQVHTRVLVTPLHMDQEKIFSFAMVMNAPSIYELDEMEEMDDMSNANNPANLEAKDEPVNQAILT